VTWTERPCDGGCGRTVGTRLPAGVGRALCTTCHPGDLPISPAPTPPPPDPYLPGHYRSRVAVGEPIDPEDVGPVCPRCFAEGRHDCCLPAERERLRVELVVDTPLERGHTYAARIPDGYTVFDLADELHRVAEVTGASLVVFRDGATVTEIEAEAVKAVTTERDRAEAELVTVRSALAEQLRVNEVLNVQRAEVERLRGLLRRGLEEAYRAGIEAERNPLLIANAEHWAERRLRRAEALAEVREFRDGLDEAYGDVL
jgi:hypothetical protein